MVSRHLGPARSALHKCVQEGWGGGGGCMSGFCGEVGAFYAGVAERSFTWGRRWRGF